MTGGIKVINTGIGYIWAMGSQPREWVHSAANKSDGRTARRMEAMSAERGDSGPGGTYIRGDPWSKGRGCSNATTTGGRGLERINQKLEIYIKMDICGDAIYEESRRDAAGGLKK
jgi:hypothetical protein